MRFKEHEAALLSMPRQGENTCKSNVTLVSAPTAQTTLEKNVE